MVVSFASIEISLLVLAYIQSINQSLSTLANAFSVNMSAVRLLLKVCVCVGICRTYTSWV